MTVFYLCGLSAAYMTLGLVDVEDLFDFVGEIGPQAPQTLGNVFMYGYG